MGEVIAAYFGTILGVAVLIYAFIVYREITLLPEGNDRMKDIASAIHEGRWFF